MRKFSVWRQYLVPQHAYTALMGVLAECRISWLKNWCIKTFIKRYNVDMQLAEIENYKEYPTFNAFFTRRLKPGIRPIASGENDIASPVDGCLSQQGNIQEETLLQAKGYFYNLKVLLGNQEDLAAQFINGDFATIYLAPRDYHRIHMPFDGKLRETIFIPGSLFSVNAETTKSVPQLFTRNERLVCIFDTKIGPMAVILVGAMIVGKIVTVWDPKPKTRQIERKKPLSEVFLKKGEELGLFELGSTVIMLFPQGKTTWNSRLIADMPIKMGELLGNEKG